MDAKKKIFVAAILGSAWIGLALWEWDVFKDPVRVPLSNVTGMAVSGRTIKDNVSGLRVNLDVLARARTQREAIFTSPRNIFAAARPDGTLPVDSHAAVDQQAAQAIAQQAAVLQLAQYRYLGFLRTGERRKKDIAVLSRNEEAVVVKVGDHVEDHLVLKTITPESVTIRDTGTHIDQTLPLSEESPAQP